MLAHSIYNSRDTCNTRAFEQVVLHARPDTFSIVSYVCWSGSGSTVVFGHFEEACADLLAARPPTSHLKMCSVTPRRHRRGRLAGTAAR